MKKPKPRSSPAQRRPPDRRRTTPEWASRDADGRLVVNIAPAKAHLSELVERIAAGDEVVLARGGKPVLRLAPLESSPKERVFGQDRGQFALPADFDTWPRGFLDSFEGPIDPTTA